MNNTNVPRSQFSLRLLWNGMGLRNEHRGIRGRIKSIVHPQGYPHACCRGVLRDFFLCINGAVLWFELVRLHPRARTLNAFVWHSLMAVVDSGRKDNAYNIITRRTFMSLIAHMLQWYHTIQPPPQARNPEK